VKHDMQGSTRDATQFARIKVSEGVSMNQRRRNWNLWAGFLLCLVAFVSYPFVFAKFPITRDVPWANFLLFAAGGAFLFVGFKRAFGKSQQYRGKIAGPILGTLSLFAAGFFCFIVFHMTRQLPPSTGSPQVGQKAPEFALSDTDGNPVSLSSLLSRPLSNTQGAPKGVLLIFYRGYW
jgi:hypothetical protein